MSHSASNDLLVMLLALHSDHDHQNVSAVRNSSTMVIPFRQHSYSKLDIKKSALAPVKLPKFQEEPQDEREHLSYPCLYP